MPRTKKGQEITMDDLAAMVKRGFDETAKQDDLLTLQEDVSSLREDVGAIDDRLKNVEYLLLKQHSEHLRSLETRVKRLEQLYEVKAT